MAESVIASLMLDPQAGKSFARVIMLGVLRKRCAVQRFGFLDTIGFKCRLGPLGMKWRAIHTCPFSHGERVTSVVISAGRAQSPGLIVPDRRAVWICCDRFIEKWHRFQDATRVLERKGLGSEQPRFARKADHPFVGRPDRLIVQSRLAGRNGPVQVGLGDSVVTSGQVAPGVERFLVPAGLAVRIGDCPKDIE